MASGGVTRGEGVWGGDTWQGGGCDKWRDRSHHGRAVQVVTPYRFALSIERAIEAVDPDVIVLLGPGTGLAGAIGQVIVFFPPIELLTLRPTRQTTPPLYSSRPGSRAWVSR